MKVTVKKGDITQENVDAIVNPANSYGTMGGGVALAIKNAGGDIIEEEAVKQAPILVGTAAITTAGSLVAKYVIHSPTMERPAERIGVDKVKVSVNAALECAVENNLSTLAFPGMGTGVGGVNKDDAAKAMLGEVKLFTGENNSIDEIIFIAFDDQLYECFTKWKKELNLETG